MKDMNKLTKELTALQQMFGKENIFWNNNFEWVLINNFILPAGINRDRCRFVVIIPPHYGNGAPIIDSFIEPGLKARNARGAYEKIDHYFKKYAHDEKLLTSASKTLWAERGWWWLCLQNRSEAANADTIDQYKTNAWHFLNEPFKDWKALFQAYRAK